VPADRLRASLGRIAAFKSIVQRPLALDLERFQTLCEEIKQLNQKLKYSYGGSV